MATPNTDSVKHQSRAYENGREDGRRRAYQEIQVAIYKASCATRQQDTRKLIALLDKLVTAAKEKSGG